MSSRSQNLSRIGAVACRRLGETIAATLAYLAMSLVYLRPVWRLWRDHLAPDLGDPLFNTWVLAWSGRQIRLGLPSPWDANIFYPVKGTLALSDHLFGPAALAQPVAEVTGSHVAAYNVLLLLAFVLCGLATYGVLRGSGLGPLASFFGGAAFTFAPYRVGQLSHLQMLFCPLVPVVLWLFDRLLARPRVGRAVLFLVAYLLHLSAGSYLAYLIHFCLLALILNRAFRTCDRRRWFCCRGLAILLPTAMVASVATILVSLPYIEIAHRLNLRRGPDAWRLYGGHLLALLTPSRFSVYFPSAESLYRHVASNLPKGFWFAEKTLFPGVIVSLMALYGGIHARRTYQRRSPTLSPRRRLALWVSATTAIVLGVAADGFTLGWWTGGHGGLDDSPGAVYVALATALAVTLSFRVVLRRRWGVRSTLDWSGLPVWPRGLAVVGIVAVAGSFPVIFTPAALVLPGLDGMRVPTRIYVFAVFAFAALAAFGAQDLLDRIRRPGFRWLGGVALLLILLVELAPRGLSWHQVPVGDAVPPVYDWLAEHHAEIEAVLELPFLDDVYQTRYMYFSTRHWQPLANGYSGHFPRPYRALRAICCWPVPDSAALARIRAMGVTHMVIHPVWPHRWAHSKFELWQTRVEQGDIPGVYEVYCDESGTRVFQLARRGGPRRVDAH